MKFALSLLLVSLSFPLLAQTGAQQKLAAADAAYTAGHLDSAMTLVDQVITLAPDQAKAYKLRGDIHQRRKDLDAAMSDYRTSEKLDPTDPRLFISRCALLITKGNFKGGLQEADRALDLDENDADAWYDRSCALYLLGDGDAALKSANKAMQLRQNYAEAIYLTGVIEGEQNDEEAGLAHIAQALKLQPKIQGGLMSEGVLLFESGQYQEAIAKFTQVINTDTTELAAAHYYRGDSYYNLDDKAHACADWEVSARMGDRDAIYIKKTYCDTDATKIPKKPKRQPRKTSIQV
jgi:tetratricopeptide (TPR) repeat protein